MNLKYRFEYAKYWIVNNALKAFYHLHLCVNPHNLKPLGLISGFFLLSYFQFKITKVLFKIHPWDPSSENQTLFKGLENFLLLSALVWAGVAVYSLVAYYLDNRDDFYQTLVEHGFRKAPMEIQEFSSFIERKIKSEGWDLYINHVPSHIFTGGDKDLIVDFDLKKVVMTRTDKWPDWILEAIEAYAMFSVMNGNNENATFVRHLADRKDYAKGNYLVKKRAAELISEHCLDDYLSIEAYTKEANLKIFSLAVMASKIEKEEGVTVTVAIAAQSIELFPSHFNYDIDSIPSEYLDLVHNLPIYVRKEAS